MIAEVGFCACKAPSDSALRPIVRVGAKYTARIIRSTPRDNVFVAGYGKSRNRPVIGISELSGKTDPTPSRQFEGRPPDVDPCDGTHKIEFNTLDPADAQAEQASDQDLNARPARRQADIDEIFREILADGGRQEAGRHAAR